MIEEENPQNKRKDSEEMDDSVEIDQEETAEEDSEEKSSHDSDTKLSPPDNKLEEKVLENSTTKTKSEEEEEIEIMDLSEDADKYADIDLDDDEQFKDMLKDFSDIEDLSIEEMMEIQTAIDEVSDGNEAIDTIEKTEVIEEEISGPIEDLYEGWGLYVEEKPEFKPEINEDLETLIQEELDKKRVKKKIVTEEEFKQYCSNRKTKIWYHALWTLVFEIEDHQAKKDTLYELLKEVTSKSPIDPIAEHKFYFGLGFILRLSLNGKKVIEFRGKKLKLNVGIDVLNDILHEVGPPISERPILTNSEKKKMFMDFLTDDFKDI